MPRAIWGTMMYGLVFRVQYLWTILYWGSFRSPRPSWLVVDFLSLGVNLHYPKYADLVIVHDPVGVVSTSLWNNFAICPWNKKICDTCSSTDVAPFPICRAIWINARRPPSENSHARLSSNNTQSWGGKLWNLWVFFNHCRLAQYIRALVVTWQTSKCLIKAKYYSISSNIAFCPKVRKIRTCLIFTAEVQDFVKTAQITIPW